MQAHDRAPKIEPVTMLAADVNEAINERQACRLHAEAEMLQLEESFNDE
jgi:hypothetical protein